MLDSCLPGANLGWTGDLRREEPPIVEIAASERKHDVLIINEALERLEEIDEQAAALVKLRYFTGLTVQESADALEIPLRSAERLWAWSKAWLYSEVQTPR